MIFAPFNSLVTAMFALDLLPLSFLAFCSEILPLNDQVLQLVEEMLKHEAAWPFKKPVSKQEAPDYHEHIKQPMDISTIKKNAKAKREIIQVLCWPSTS